MGNNTNYIGESAVHNTIMAKPSRNVAFRKVDVDQYSEENYVEDAGADDEVSGPNDAELQGMLAKYPWLCSSCWLQFRVLLFPIL